MAVPSSILGAKKKGGKKGGKFHSCSSGLGSSYIHQQMKVGCRLLLLFFSFINVTSFKVYFQAKASASMAF